MNLTPGSELGAYRIIERVGRGGMASVYKAHQAALARYVAVKILPDYLADDQDFRDRFQHEAMAVASLRHPNIPAIYDYGESEGVTYIAGDFIDGGTLADQMGEPLPLEYVIRILGPIGSAIDYAHSRGVLHRDIKPQNIMLTREGQPMLNDFGLARMMESEVRVTQANTVMGTPQYMAPEQCAGSDVGQPADLYSLGVVAYEMLTGRVPFAAATPAAVIMAQIQDPLPPPRSVNPRLSENVERVLLKALAKSPKDRYTSATAFLDALALGATAGGGVARPGRPTGATTVVRRPAGEPAPASRRWLYGAGVVPLVVLLVGAAFLLSHRAGGPAGGTGSSGSTTTSQFGSPWTPGAAIAKAAPLAPRGALSWQAALKGDLSDFASPATFGAPSATVVAAKPGYVDIAVVKRDGHVRLDSLMPPADRYVGELQMAIRPGSHFSARWIFRRGDGKTTGDLVAMIDADQGRLSFSYAPPGGGSPEGIDQKDMPELARGGVFTLTADTAPDSDRVYLNQAQIEDFGEARVAPTASMSVEAFGQGGEFRVLDLRAYGPPS